MNLQTTKQIIEYRPQQQRDSNAQRSKNWTIKNWTIRSGDGPSSKSWNDFTGGPPRTEEFPRNLVIALDVHGTLISRNRADDLQVVQEFRETISRPAKEAGVPIVMVSAAPTRELQRVASLLDLGSQPAVAELGHVLMTEVLQAPPRLPPEVTPHLLEALLDLKRWLVVEGLPPGIFLEPKTVLVTLNWSDAPDERDGLVALIERYIRRHGLPLYVSVSDATIDVGIRGVDKASGLAAIMAAVGTSVESMSVVAVGDSRNDLDLLRVASPGLCGCPANAHETVKEYVGGRGGFVSEYSTLAGTMDAISQLLRRIAAQTAELPLAPLVR